MRGCTDGAANGSLGWAGAVSKGSELLGRFRGVENGSLTGAAALPKGILAFPALENGLELGTCGLLKGMTGAARLANALLPVALLLLSEGKNGFPWDWKGLLGFMMKINR